MTLTANRPSQELVDIVAALDGKWHGSYAMCPCPAHADGDPSLSLRQGDRGILAKCFAGCQTEDVLRALRTLNPTRGTPPPNCRPTRGRANASRLWERAIGIKATLAERYLLGRKLPLDLPDIRFLERCPHGPKPHTVFKPAMLVAVREGHEVVAIQRIFLDPDSGKRTKKLMIGSPGAGAWKPPMQGTSLAIAEGFEDAAAYTLLHNIPCWAALGASRLHLLAVPEQVDTLIIAEDNNRAGRVAARRAWQGYRGQGLNPSYSPDRS